MHGIRLKVNPPSRVESSRVESSRVERDESGIDSSREESSYSSHELRRSNRVGRNSRDGVESLACKKGREVLDTARVIRELHRNAIGLKWFAIVRRSKASGSDRLAVYSRKPSASCLNSESLE